MKIMASVLFNDGSSALVQGDIYKLSFDKNDAKVGLSLIMPYGREQYDLYFKPINPPAVNDNHAPYVEQVWCTLGHDSVTNDITATDAHQLYNNIAAWMKQNF